MLQERNRRGEREVRPTNQCTSTASLTVAAIPDSPRTNHNTANPRRGARAKAAPTTKQTASTNTISFPHEVVGALTSKRSHAAIAVECESTAAHSLSQSSASQRICRSPLQHAVKRWISSPNRIGRAVTPRATTRTHPNRAHERTRSPAKLSGSARL